MARIDEMQGVRGVNMLLELMKYNQIGVEACFDAFDTDRDGRVNR